MPSWHLRPLATFGLVVDADPDEVRGVRLPLDVRFAELLGPYVTRPEAERPAGAAPVRVLRHVLPS